MQTNEALRCAVSPVTAVSTVTSQARPLIIIIHRIRAIFMLMSLPFCKLPLPGGFDGEEASLPVRELQYRERLYLLECKAASMLIDIVSQSVWSQRSGGNVRLE